MFSSKVKGWAAGIGGLSLVGFGFWIGHHKPEPPPDLSPKLAEHAPAEPTKAELLMVQVLDNQTKLIEALQQRREEGGRVIRDDSQSAQMTAILLALTNELRAQHGETPIAPSSSAADVAAALAAAGGKLLPERIVDAPCKTRGRMHGVLVPPPAEWELIPEWDPCAAEAKKNSWFSRDAWTTGTRYYAILGGAAWGNANLSVGDSLAASQLSLDGTQLGWKAGLGTGWLFVSPSGRWLHEFDLEATYKSSPTIDGWEISVAYKPGWFRASKP